MNRTALIFLLAILTISLFGPTGCKNPYCPTGEDPYVVIDKPPPSYTVLPLLVKFTWHSGLEEDPRAVRYFASLVVNSEGIYDPYFDVVRDLNENPERYEDKWSEWINYKSPDETGVSAIIGDDEEIEANKHYFFVVQAMDRCGRITETFTRGVNFRQYIASASLGPMMTVMDTYLGYYMFVGLTLPPAEVDLPSGAPINFNWMGYGGNYGGVIQCYRYGWDIADLNDPSAWETGCVPGLISAPQKIFYSGVHTFHVEAMDDIGHVVRGAIQINIVPFPMERNLLLVDDFYSTDFPQVLYHLPTETEHDNFWLDICSRADGFMAGVDIFDTQDVNFHPPDISKIGQYKNIIWTYNADYDYMAWDDMIRFTPESWTTIGTARSVNYLSLFLAKGGHLWTVGRGDREGGFAAVLSPLAMMFPMNLECEITGNAQDCAGDRSGVHTMPYRDYCVTVLDKVNAVFRTDLGMPVRSIDRDAMYYAYKDETFGYNDPYPGLPDQLQLWSEVTAPGRFFDPAVRGFTYVEIYDPQYWMDLTAIQNQDCFAPMYRMRARSSLSPVDHTTIALWSTRYENVTPDVAAGIAVPARSVHFGFPLWFFDRTQVDQIADVIFDEWQINASP